MKILNLRIYEIERNEIKTNIFLKKLFSKTIAENRYSGMSFISSTQEAEPGSVVGFLYSLRVRHRDPK